VKWYLRACPVCGGDLHDDIEERGWVTCFMCARSFPFVGTLDREALLRRTLDAVRTTRTAGALVATGSDEKQAA
jgi:hypothetical protein